MRASGACLLRSLVLVAACLHCVDPAATTPPPGTTQSQLPDGNGSQVLPPRVDPFSHAVAVAADRAFLGRGGELIVFELGQPTRPRELGRVQLEGEVRDIALAGPHAFVALRGAGLSIVDCSRPEEPTQVSLFELPLAEGVDVSRDRAYVVAQTGGLRVLDVSNPAAPPELGSYQILEAALKVEIQGSLAYVAASYAGMRILDVGDPARISEVGFATRKSYGQGAAWNVTVSGDRTFSAIPDNGLRQVDVKDPGKAETLSIYRKLHAPVAVVVKGRHAFVADQSAGLRVIDVSQKRTRGVGRLAIDDSVMDVALAGSRLLLALKTGGLAVVDVSHPATPRLVALPGSLPPQG